eukprot:c8481_g1_i1.p1 GENE.c8481_g1_i1~~c8481_g1_i1.p1  ORF type:complete len:778 (-),score=148.24 c8481_g1_i1:104-2176(-)
MYYGFNATNVVEYLSQPPNTFVNLTLDVVGPYAMRQYDTMYNVTFKNDNKEVSYKTWSKFQFTPEKSCTGCNNTDRFVGLNPGFLNLMTATGSEFIIGLLTSSADLRYGALGYNKCTPDAIAFSLAAEDCNPLNASTPLCCCNNSRAETGMSSCYNRGKGLYSTFSAFDNGIEFTPFSRDSPATSPLFVKKNVHEFAYGYPSALLGLIIGTSLASSGKFADLAVMANYTDLVLQACSYSSTGLSPNVDEMKDKPYQHISLTTCAPVAGSLYWTNLFSGVKACSLVNQQVGCKCLISTHGTNGMSTSDKPCCTYAGLGCLRKIPGYVSDEMYLSEDQVYDDYPTDNTTQSTGCGSFDSEKEFWWSTYESLKAKPVWTNITALYVDPSQLDIKAAAKDPNFYFAPTMGSDGTRSKGVGHTSGSFSKELTDGKPKYDSRTVFITQVYRPTTVHFKGTTKFNGITLAKYSPNQDFLSQAVKAYPLDVDNGIVGGATPYSGIADISYIAGFPAYVSRPLFLYGDAEALHQTTCNRTNPQTATVSCSGINIMIDGESALPDPVLYETYLNVEPATGLTMEGHKRLMASFGLYKCVSKLQGCTPYFGVGLANLLSPYVPGGKVIPQYWMDETSQATDDQVSKFKSLEMVSYSADVVLLVLTLFGSLFIVAGAALVVIEKRRPPRVRVVTESLMSNMQ